MVEIQEIDSLLLSSLTKSFVYANLMESTVIDYLWRLSLLSLEIDMVTYFYLVDIQSL